MAHFDLLSTSLNSNLSTNEAATTNTYRNVWFSDNTNNLKRVHDTDFQYNPGTNDLKVGTINGINVSNLIELGTNYCRFSNGLQICWGTQNKGQQATTQRGQLHAVTYDPEITFQKSFISEPSVLITPRSNVLAIVGSVNATSTGINSLSLFRTETGDIYRVVSWLAIGKWK